jgi:hypothetical protein
VTTGFGGFPSRHLYGGFHPSDVPAIAAGYWWDPDIVIAGTPNVLPEQNGTATWNLNLSAGCTFTSNGGHQQVVMPAANFGQTGTNQAAGWTGATYFGFWARRGVATPPNGTNNIFNHGNAFVAASGRLNLFELNSGIDTIRMSNGSSLLDNRYTPPNDALFNFREYLFLVPNVISYLNGIQRTAGLDGINFASVNDVSNAPTLGNGITEWTFGPVYYGNGLPSDAERARLMAYHSPI